MNLKEFEQSYIDNPEWQKATSDLFIELTNNITPLKELRDYVERNIMGFGEREFLYMHKIIVDSFDKKDLTMLEIGVFRGQILATYGLLRGICDKNIEIIGVTPLDSSDGHWESDYKADIEKFHNDFAIPQPRIIKGLSSDKLVLHECESLEVNILYIDGSHKYEDVLFDIENYSQLIPKGGYLIIDDSANHLGCCYDGRFWGISDVSNAVDRILPPITNNDKWKHVGNIIHNRIWRRVK